MLNFLKSILNPYSIDKVHQLRDAIINNCSNETWFKNSFDITDNLYKPITKNIAWEDSKINYMAQTMILSEDIKKALIKNFLIENSYLQKLSLRKRQLVFCDSYGDINIDDWVRESQTFSQKREIAIMSYIINKTPPVLKHALASIDRLQYFHSFEEFEQPLHEFIIQIVDDIEFDDFAHITVDVNQEITPYEYENIIASHLCNFGWNAYHTSGSGDQGADVVAEKHGLKYVFQCKLYNQPVGNNAVQEVSSARDYYEAFGAVVVTNNDYTKSARQLAESQNVWLIHDSYLEEWSNNIDIMILEIADEI
ncbi:restriction endonuclease [Shewanella glacialimarina]|uniref:restriction endonuclease n=1 Tax=Shewanella glacialimarina TaxID=2590884 RepID=UPI001CF7FDD3|nr:restriction endonuclease [Shewanella glacialimarina]UCX05878.1 restriction endonuclease [Shewanella glacialimarina]